MVRVWMGSRKRGRHGDGLDEKETENRTGYGEVTI